MAVCWTDLFQGMLMLIALIVTPIMALQAVGPINGLMNTAYIDFINIFTYSSGTPVGAIVIISWAAWGFGYFGQPIFWQGLWLSVHQRK